MLASVSLSLLLSTKVIFNVYSLIFQATNFANHPLLPMWPISLNSSLLIRSNPKIDTAVGMWNVMSSLIMGCLRMKWNAQFFTHWSPDNCHKIMHELRILSFLKETNVSIYSWKLIQHILWQKIKTVFTLAEKRSQCVLCSIIF